MVSSHPDKPNDDHDINASQPGSTFPRSNGGAIFQKLTYPQVLHPSKPCFASLHPELGPGWWLKPSRKILVSFVTSYLNWYQPSRG